MKITREDSYCVPVGVQICTRKRETSSAEKAYHYYYKEHKCHLDPYNRLATINIAAYAMSHAAAEVCTAAGCRAC